MAYEPNNGADRKMYQGNWKCGKCGGAITELPFEPDPSREESLMCRDCHRAQRDSAPQRDRQMYEGNWPCSKCGGSITQLPFEPRDTSNLMCRDCFRK